MLELRRFKVAIILSGGLVIMGQSGCGSSSSVTMTPPPVNLQWAFVANYLDNNISGYVIDSASGTLKSTGSGPFPAGTGPFSIAVDPSGKFAYVANALSNNISGYSIDLTTGTLTPLATMIVVQRFTAAELSTCTYFDSSQHLLPYRFRDVPWYVDAFVWPIS
jgi:DNA-binding beta-propeller fold protein YncE